VPGLFDAAGAFAQAILRTDAAADFRHVVGGGGKGVLFLQAALRGEAEPVRNIVGQRAMVLTERNAALASARRLRFGVTDGKALVDLAKILKARLCGALSRRFSIKIGKPQHRRNALPFCLFLIIAPVLCAAARANQRLGTTLRGRCWRAQEKNAAAASNFHPI
jgi:hypothetical protein